MQILTYSTGQLNSTIGDTELIPAPPSGKYGIFNIRISVANASSFSAYVTLKIGSDIILEKKLITDSAGNDYCEVKGVLLGAGQNLSRNVTAPNGSNLVISANGYLEDVNNPI